jgi:hypothetical protein
MLIQVDQLTVNAFPKQRCVSVFRVTGLPDPEFLGTDRFRNVSNFTSRYNVIYWRKWTVSSTSRITCILHLA